MRNLGDLPQGLWTCEQLWWQAACTQFLPERVLCIQRSGRQQAMVQAACMLSQASRLPADVLAEPWQTPWQASCFDAIVASHIHETLPATILPFLLDEWWRVAAPQAYLYLAGWQSGGVGVHSRWTQHANVQAANDVRQAAQATGWTCVQTRYFHCLPTWSWRAWRLDWQWVAHDSELTGQVAAAYGLILQKQTVLPIDAGSLQPEWQFNANWAMAREIT